MFLTVFKNEFSEFFYSWSNRKAFSLNLSEVLKQDILIDFRPFSSKIKDYIEKF